MEKTIIKISIVVPVYNAERYIRRCIESLKAQTLKELEFIFVDDCFPDKSMHQVEQWASSDSRVRILRNEVNLGEGESRNRGIEAARGLYVNTIDPDDWVAPDYYELLYDKALETSADIVKGTRIKISEETLKEEKPRSSLNNKITECLAKGVPLYRHLNYEHQTLVFKRNLINEKTKYGKSGNAADTVFLLRLCSRDVSFATEDRAYYYYLQRNTSATGQYSLRRSKNELISLEEQISYFLQEGIIEEQTYGYCAGRFHSYATRFVHCCETEQITPEEKKQFIKDFRTQFLRLPDYKRLYGFDMRIFALIEKNVVLGNGLYEDPDICKMQVADWMAYIMALDGEQQKVTYKKMESMLVNYANKRENLGVSPREIIKEILHAGDEIKGLRPKLKLYEIINRVLKSLRCRGKQK